MSTTQIAVLLNSQMDTVVLKWTKTLSHEVDRDLYDALEGLAGVETVHLRRYSAELTYALHVTTGGELVKEIRELLEDPSGPVAALFGGPVKVTP